jgi:DNA polymerase-3 subunit delta'
MWKRIRGHDNLVTAFTHAWKRGRLAHAYLFTGPEGVGKRLFAVELAKAILCEDPPADRLEACGKCPACILVDSNTHPDYFTLGRPEDKNEIPVEVLRELCRGFTLKSARGRGKIAVLDDADDLNEESANCFLKTLEEPPPRSMFILVGSSADRQLATVVSRCQVVRFAPLPADVVADLVKAQGIQDDQQIRRAVRLAGGSPGLALALTDPPLWEFRKVLLGGLSQPQPDTPALAIKFKEFVEEAGKDAPAQRRRAALVLRLLVEFLKDALAVHMGTAPRLDEAEDVRFLKSFVQRVDADQIMLMLERCLEAEMHLDRYVQVVLLLEGLLDSLGQLSLSASS